MGKLSKKYVLDVVTKKSEKIMYVFVLKLKEIQTPETFVPGNKVLAMTCIKKSA